MTSQVKLNIVSLKDARKVGNYIRLDLLQKHNPNIVCNALFEAATVEESISPAVIRIFLEAARSLECVKTCLQQISSVLIQTSAIIQYCKTFANIEHWKEAWTAVGGIPGILHILKAVSVNDVRLFLKCIGRCNNGRRRSSEREAEVEELLKCLACSRYQDAKYENPDRRPLETFASYLVPGCSGEFVRTLLKDGMKDPLYAKCKKGQLIKNHCKSIHDYVLETLTRKDLKTLPEDVLFYLTKLSTRMASEPATISRDSSVTGFNLRLVRIFAADQTIAEFVNRSFQRAQGYSSDFVGCIYLQLLKRSLKHKKNLLPRPDIIDIGLQILENKPEGSGYPGSTIKNEIWKQINQHWRYNRSKWQTFFVRGLRLGLAGSDIPSIFMQIITNKLEKQKAWDLLALLSYHVPKRPINLEAHFELKPLAELKWSLEVFKRLPDDKAIWLLEALMGQSVKQNFLVTRKSNSILKNTHSQDDNYLNATLRLIQLRVRSKDANERDAGFMKASQAYEYLKSKSVSSREQPDRAEYARLAGLYAVASSSLELYDKYVEWLARFIRDPLTVKVLFSRANLASKEAVNVLSGIPKHLSGDIRLDDIAGNVEKANSILLKLHKHRTTAKREPSYQEYDWNAIDWLLKESVECRISRAKQLQSLALSDAQLFTQIWSQTFAMYSQSTSVSMGALPGSLSRLMTSLSPRLLTEVVHHFLEVDKNYRAANAKGGQAEDGSRVIERLIFDSLIALAAGDNPTLVGDLLVDLIIERPDASSWHRQLLSSKFLKRLPARNAERVLFRFSTVIGRKLEEQSFVRIGEPPNAPPIIKVTTVKALAQLLQDAQFIPAEDSTSILVELFKVTPHPDVRYATLESLLSTLKKLAPIMTIGGSFDRDKIKNSQVQAILAALDSIIPVVGSINERRPPAQQDWLDAAKDPSTLPVLSSEPGSQPLWSLLVQTAKDSNVLRTYFVEHLLMPILMHSAVEHQKWMEIFLKKHEAGHLINYLLRDIPISITMFQDLASAADSLSPENLIRSWKTYAHFSLIPSNHITDFSRRLSKDEKKNNEPDVKHFLKWFSPSVTDIVQNCTYRFIDLFLVSSIETASEIEQIAKSEQILNAVTEQLWLIIHHHYDRNIALWNEIMKYLRCPAGQPIDHDIWLKKCGPIVRKVIKCVDNLRTSDWNKNPRREPSILPSTLLPELWLLDHPTSNSSTDELRRKSDIAGQQISLILRGYGNRNWLKVRPELLSIGQELPEIACLRIALVLGIFQNLNELEQMLRVNAAIEFIAMGRKELSKTLNIRAKIKKMIQNWRTSDIEDIRELVSGLQMMGSYGNLWNTINHQE